MTHPHLTNVLWVSQDIVLSISLWPLAEAHDTIIDQKWFHTMYNIGCPQAITIKTDLVMAGYLEPPFMVLKFFMLGRLGHGSSS